MIVHSPVRKSQVSDGFIEVALEFIIRNARMLIAFAAIATVGVNFALSSNTSELSGFYNNHTDVGRSASRNSFACTQYTSSRLANRLNDDNFLEVADSRANHTAWDGSTVLSYPDTTFLMLGGVVSANVGCELVPSGNVGATYSSSNVLDYPGLYVKYEGIDDSLCSSFISEIANRSWVTMVDGIIVKQHNEDSATGLYQDGSTVCVSGDSNTIEIFDRPKI